jgi:predicted porin
LKKAAFITLALAATGAHAQTAVTIYGIADAGLVGENGGSAGHQTKVTSGAGTASRIGFRGTEDLGGGMQAFFTLESGPRIDTGTLDAANTIFNRQALVGLKSSIGSIALGRQYTPYHLALVQAIDPFGTNYAGTSKNLLPDNGNNVRASNSVTYSSPKLQGVNVDLFYSAGEQAKSSAGRQVGAGINYAHGPLALRAVYNAKNSDVVATGVNHDIGRNYLVGGNYDFKVIQVYAGYEVDKGFNSAPLFNPNNPYGGVAPTASTDGRDTILGFTAPVGPGTLMFSTQYKNDRTRFNQDASEWGIGYLYRLSKRTGLYTAYAHINNKNGAGYTVGNNSESGTGNTGYSLGIRHAF